MSKGEWNAFQSDWWRPKALGWVEISKFTNEMHCMLIGWARKKSLWVKMGKSEGLGVLLGHEKRKQWAVSCDNRFIDKKNRYKRKCVGNPSHLNVFICLECSLYRGHQHGWVVPRMSITQAMLRVPHPTVCYFKHELDYICQSVDLENLGSLDAEYPRDFL